jgi:anti-anti-sigma factor
VARGKTLIAQHFQIIRTEEADCIVVVLRGEIDVDAAAALSAALAPDSGRPFVVDLSATTFMDSTGVRALMAARQSGVVISSVRNIPDNVYRVFDVLGLAAVLPLDR